MGDSDDQNPQVIPVLTTAVGGNEAATVPVLTSVVGAEAPADGGVPMPGQPASPMPARLSDEELLALRSRLASATRNLAERLIEESLGELEMALFESVSARLREQLPDILEQALRDHFDAAD
ncbi:MAG: hypothetical protein PVG91_00640 [Gammaproteobacteria bacterium]|jgi:hypothetical protein